ncbi:MAG: hypothetical protein ACOX5W_00655 [Bacillota bacterium]|jgi:hypothetical protein
MVDQNLSRVVQQHYLAQRLARQSTEKIARVLDDLMDNSTSGQSMLSWDFLAKAKQQVEDCLHNGQQAVKIAVLVPVGLFGLTQGFDMPDLDISLLGIGNHRFFLCHSAIGLAVLRYFYRRWVESEDGRFSSRLGHKVAGVALGSCALGVGLHLAIDVFQPKSVVFPFFGSLINGTLVDDNIWLLGNSLWAFKISHDVFALSLADELTQAREWVQNHFEGWNVRAVFNRD